MKLPIPSLSMNKNGQPSPRTRLFEAIKSESSLFSYPGTTVVSQNPTEGLKECEKSSHIPLSPLSYGRGIDDHVGSHNGDESTDHLNPTSNMHVPGSHVQDDSVCEEAEVSTTSSAFTDSWISEICMTSSSPSDPVQPAGSSQMPIPTESNDSEVDITPYSLSSSLRSSPESGTKESILELSRAVGLPPIGTQGTPESQEIDGGDEQIESFQEWVAVTVTIVGSDKDFNGYKRATVEPDSPALVENCINCGERFDPRGVPRIHGSGGLCGSSTKPLKKRASTGLKIRIPPLDQNRRFSFDDLPHSTPVSQSHGAVSESPSHVSAKSCYPQYLNDGDSITVDWEYHFNALDQESPKGIPGIELSRQRVGYGCDESGEHEGSHPDEQDYEDMKRSIASSATPLLEPGSNQDEVYEHRCSKITDYGPEDEINNQEEEYDEEQEEDYYEDDDGNEEDDDDDEDDDDAPDLPSEMLPPQLSGGASYVSNMKFPETTPKGVSEETQESMSSKTSQEIYLDTQAAKVTEDTSAKT